MTKFELGQKHFDKYYDKATGAGVEEHTNVSIEYAISVLEELMPDEPPFVVSDGEIKRKIRNLKSLLQ